MQGAARREYRAYCQGLQRRSGALRSLPKGALMRLYSCDTALDTTGA